MGDPKEYVIGAVNAYRAASKGLVAREADKIAQMVADSSRQQNWRKFFVKGGIGEREIESLGDTRRLSHKVCEIYYRHTEVMDDILFAEGQQRDFARAYFDDKGFYFIDTTDELRSIIKDNLRVAQSRAQLVETLWTHLGLYSSAAVINNWCPDRIRREFAPSAFREFFFALITNNHCQQLFWIEAEEEWGEIGRPGSRNKNRRNWGKPRYDGFGGDGWLNMGLK